MFKSKVVVIYGARQVGKTTLVQAILGQFPDHGLYLNCDEPDIWDALTNRTSTELRALMGRRTLVVIDEAQRVRNIGLALKLLVDNFPDLQVIATGSSSFELSNTGCGTEFCMSGCHSERVDCETLVAANDQRRISRAWLAAAKARCFAGLELYRILCG